MPIGVYKHKPMSEETKKKISKANKGRIKSKEWLDNLSKSLKGRKIWNEGLTKETNESLKHRSKILMGRKYPEETYPNKGMRGKKRSVEDRKRISERLTGQILSEETKEKISKKIKLFYKNCNEDFKKERSKKISKALKGRKKPPRSEEHRKKISEAHKGKTAWNKGEHLSEEKLKEVRDKVYSNPERNKKISEALRGVPRPGRQGIMPKNLQYPGRYRNGYYNINGKRIYFRSKWEANYSLYLDFLVKQKQIKKWTYEKDVFIFEKIKFGTRSYRPDFKIYNNDNTISYHEVKGYMDSKSKTKIKRMAKYYPDVELIIIDKDVYRDIKRKLGKMLKFF